MKVQNMNKSHKDSVKKHWRKMNFEFKVAMGASEIKDKLDKMRGLGGEMEKACKNW